MRLDDLLEEFTGLLLTTLLEKGYKGKLAKGKDLWGKVQEKMATGLQSVLPRVAQEVHLKSFSNNVFLLRNCHAVSKVFIGD